MLAMRVTLPDGKVVTTGLNPGIVTTSLTYVARSAETRKKFGISRRGIAQERLSRCTLVV